MDLCGGVHAVSGSAGSRGPAGPLGLQTLLLPQENQIRESCMTIGD